MQKRSLKANCSPSSRYVVCSATFLECPMTLQRLAFYYRDWNFCIEAGTHLRQEWICKSTENFPSSTLRNFGGDKMFKVQVDILSYVYRNNYNISSQLSSTNLRTTPKCITHLRHHRD